MTSSRESTKSKSIKIKDLPILLRFFLYGLQGVAFEVVYFALLDSFNNRELYLVGRTHVLILPIYGLGFLLVERISSYLRSRNVSVCIRGLVYTFVGYTFEFSTGYFLSIIGQNYWDYSDYSYNFKGLIIPHTAPGWFLYGLAAEKIIFDGIKRLRLVS